MGVSDIAERLSEPFALMRSTVRGGATRHRSLRAVVDWSYRALDVGERTLFDALAVFLAGCELDAAVRTGVAAGPEEDEVIDTLDGLVTKSRPG
jgi:predicted ATPase